MDKKKKSTKLTKLAIVLFCIGFEGVTFELFMRLVYINEPYMARWTMWVFYVIGFVFLVPALYLFYKTNKMKEEERNEYYQTYFAEEEKKIDVQAK